eukprot:CCRYP_005361-RA/>CCRYP_005361-RA protein AED:0.25 eAED:0.22 QI:0/0/0/1/0/0/2/0/134
MIYNNHCMMLMWNCNSQLHISEVDDSLSGTTAVRSYNSLQRWGQQTRKVIGTWDNKKIEKQFHCQRIILHIVLTKLQDVYLPVGGYCQWGRLTAAPLAKAMKKRRRPTSSLGDGWQISGDGIYTIHWRIQSPRN